MVLCSKVNKNLALTPQSKTAGSRGISLSGMDGGLFQAKRLTDRSGTDYGYVSDIMDVDPSPVVDVLQQGYIRSFRPLHRGTSTMETNYNINADTA